MVHVGRMLMGTPHKVAGHLWLRFEAWSWRVLESDGNNQSVFFWVLEDFFWAGLELHVGGTSESSLRWDTGVVQLLTG